METILAFGREYGWVAVVAALLLANAGKVIAFCERAIGRVWPAFAEARREAAVRELEHREQARVEKDRVDTVLALKDMLLSYRQALDDTNLERRQLQNRLYEIVQRYERHDAQFIEALRDISMAIRAQTERLDKLSARISVVAQPESD